MHVGIYNSKLVLLDLSDCFYYPLIQNMVIVNIHLNDSGFWPLCYQRENCVWHSSFQDNRYCTKIRKLITSYMFLLNKSSSKKDTKLVEFVHSMIKITIEAQNLSFELLYYAPSGLIKGDEALKSI
jgi:hypothetical protein